MLIGRYVRNEWLKYMGITFVATFSLLMFEDMCREFPELLIHGMGPVLHHYFLLFPHLFCAILPISAFVSVLMSLCRLRDNNEFIAMQSTGVNNWQITGPIWAWGVIMSAVMMFLQIHLVTRSRNTNHYNVSYQDERSGRLWLLGHLNLKSGHAENIFVWDPGPPIRQLRAQSARWNGRSWSFKKVAESSGATRGKELCLRSREEEIFSEFYESPYQIISQQKRPKDMCLRELRQTLQWNSEKSSRTNAYRVRFYALHMACLGPLIAFFCAIPFAMRGIRQNPTIGVAKAIGLLFIFHLLTGLSHSMGNNGIFNPMVAAGLPFLLPISVGILCSRC
ncbi:MAG: LptF/LptG family permease [Puniceicoccales bacterium]|jgi:lipopolysaccharide export system permease protein|nr:LptF/LptG family permease [Puniceicoccales bacterium]